MEKSTHLRGSGAHLGRAFGRDRVTKNSPAATTATTTTTTATTTTTTATTATASLKIDGQKNMLVTRTRGHFGGPFCRDTPSKTVPSHLRIMSFHDTTSARGVVVNALGLKSGGQKVPGSNPLSGI